MNGYEMLDLVLFVGDKLMFPTFNKVYESFEDYQRRRGLLRQWQRWEQDGTLQRIEQAGAVVWRLTESGQRRMGAVEDARRYWKTPWDGLWRMLLFDLPARERRMRTALWRWLRQERFGYLQDSVWIRPQPVQQVLEALGWARENPEAFVLLETKQVAGASQASIIKGAWDFEKTNAEYRTYLSFVRDWSAKHLKKCSLNDLAILVGKERAGYLSALAVDPLLPEPLLPGDYLGQTAYGEREAFLTRLRRVIPERL